MDFPSLNQVFHDVWAMKEHEDIRGRWEGLRISSKCFVPVVSIGALLEVLLNCKISYGNPLECAKHVLKACRKHASLLAYQTTEKSVRKSCLTCLLHRSKSASSSETKSVVYDCSGPLRGWFFQTPHWFLAYKWLHFRTISVGFFHGPVKELPAVDLVQTEIFL